MTMLLVFFVVTTDYSAIIGGESILILQVVLEGAFYPAIAVAERIVEVDPVAKVRFLCSGREIDSRILGRSI